MAEESSPIEEAEVPQQSTKIETLHGQSSNSHQAGTVVKSKPVEMPVHAELKGNKKDFKEYLLEGVLIFIAVTLGFFADNLREHFAELNTIHDYLNSYREELIVHKITIHDYDSLFSAAMIAEDSMTTLFYTKQENDNLQTTGRLLLKARRVYAYFLDDAAYRQLVNAGGLKYIHNPELNEAMSSYAGLRQRFLDFNQIKYADRTAYLPALNALDDLHDYVSQEQIPKLDAYPSLTERERRFIVSFYRQYYLQFNSNRKSLATMLINNEQVLKMIDQELIK